MSTTRARAAQRANVGALDGFYCYLCGVPTAEQSEHVEPRADGGNSRLSNLRLACPYCNQRKGKRSLAEFQEKELWRLTAPEGLPPSVRAMAHVCFGWQPTGSGRQVIASGCLRAKLVVEDGKVATVVRPSKTAAWVAHVLGAETDRLVIAAAWDFLYRHKLRPPKTPPTISAEALADD